MLGEKKEKDAISDAKFFFFECVCRRRGWEITAQQDMKM